jgi:hypothetical protein
MYVKATNRLTPTMATSGGDPCTRRFWVVLMLARLGRAALIAVTSACILAACAPTYAPHMDMPATALLPQPAASDCTTALNTEKIAPLDPPPLLPDAMQAPCSLGSGMAACFTLDQDIVRQKRFKILHDDRDYCRDAYDRARERSGEQRVSD